MQENLTQNQIQVTPFPGAARRLARHVYYMLHRKGVRRCINGLDVTLSAHIARGVPELVTGPLLDIWLAECRNARIVIDVGANVGVWSALAARVLPPQGHVHALEPAPLAYEYLLDGARVHRGPGRILAVRAVASDTNGTIRFSVADGPFATTNRVGGERGTNEIEVVACTIDSLELDPQVIKIDVEGYELFVLRGARATLARSNVTVLVDLHWVPQFGMTPQAFLELSRELGYDVSTPDGDALTTPSALHGADAVVLRRLINHEFQK